MELKTARLRLRPAARRDRDDFIALEQYPEVMRFLSGEFPEPPGAGWRVEIIEQPRRFTVYRS